MKKSRWIGLVCVLLAAVAIVVYKQRAFGTAILEIGVGSPSVILVADLNEAEEAGDRCGEIIRAVRATGKRGVKVEELMPNSASELLARYRVVNSPTVVILGKDGGEAVRYEGEEEKTVHAIKAHLATLSRD